MKRWLAVLAALAVAAGGAMFALRPDRPDPAPSGRDAPASVPAPGAPGAARDAAGNGAAGDAPTAAAIEFASTDLHTVGAGTIARTIPVTGTLTPVDRTTVKTRVAGEIVQLAVREGEQVREGQLVARLDPA
ncbi:MAG TPA: biotin/lipoyl-binding protein, partial [Zeimonas sp.]|nr:biotin/lipoyl-binding protein [Zeimonas sp.]